MMNLQQWDTIAPALNSLLMAMVLYILAFLRQRLEKLVKKVDSQGLFAVSDRRRDGRAPPDGEDRRGPAPGRRHLDHLRQRLHLKSLAGAKEDKKQKEEKDE